MPRSTIQFSPKSYRYPHVSNVAILLALRTQNKKHRDSFLVYSLLASHKVVFAFTTFLLPLADKTIAIVIL